jgi:glycosyltransferase involved in cell wall biosynthesis
MIKILAAKTFTGNPADGIDNFNKAVFGGIKDGAVEFYLYSDVPLEEKGAIRRLMVPKYRFLLTGKADWLWGIGRASELPLLLIKPKRTKYAINFHTILIKGGGGPWTVKTPWFLRKFLFSRADLIVCPSEFSAQSVRKYFPHKKVVSILNGVDLELFNPKKKNEKYLKEKFRLDFSKPIVVYVGTLQPRKRPEVFIAVAEKYQGANFVMVGRQVSAGSFGEKISNARNVTWIESMSREDVACLFASSRILLFPSLNEPAAAVILEAMASGCVPVVSKSGGNPEFFKDGESGFLIEPREGELDDFVAKIDLLLNKEEEQLRFSQAARREAERHSWDAVAQKYFEALKNNL